MKQVGRVRAYLRYRLKAKTSYGIQAPFLFNYMQEVVEQKWKKNLVCSQIEQLRKHLLHNQTMVPFVDFGTGRKKASISDQRRICDIARHSAKSKKYARLLFKTVQYFRPTTILELGTSLGISTAYLSAANPSAKVVTIEGCPAMVQQALINFQTLSLNNIEVRGGEFSAVLPSVLQEVSSIDFVFIDGNHCRKATLDYYKQIKPHLTSKSVVVIDDIHYSKDMEAAWREIIADPFVRVSLDFFAMGMLFPNKDLSKEHFLIRY